MNSYRDFNGNPMMPGLSDDFSDYRDAFCANMPDPSEAYNGEDFFDYDQASGTTNDFESARHYMQSSALNSFEVASSAAATVYPFNTSEGNDIPWKKGRLPQEEAVVNANLTNTEYQAILSMRAGSQNFINPPLDPQPCGGIHHEPSAFDYTRLSLESYASFHPHPPPHTSPMQDFVGWAPGTPNAVVQSATVLADPVLQHDQSNSMLHPWSVGNKCQRYGCSVKTVFKTLSSYRMHLRNIHDLPLLCDIEDCSHKKPFGRKTDFTRHQRSVHSQTRDYICTVPSCEVSFARKDHLSKHVREKHDTYFCPIQHCPRAKRNRFVTLEDVQAHVSGSEHGEYECALKSCARAPLSKFTLWALENHLRNHHGLQDVHFLLGKMALTTTKTTVTEGSIGRRRTPRECVICRGTGQSSSK